MSATQQNNAVTVGSGFLSAIGTYFANGGTVEITKVIVFSILGAALGFYVNKFLKWWHS